MKALGEVRKITAVSSVDGLSIDGWLTLPPGYREGQRVPLILNRAIPDINRQHH